MMRRIRRGDQGAALVEFALVLPILLMLSFGIIEFGMMTRDALILHQAAREGVRSASLGSSTGTISARIRNAAAGLTIASSNIVVQKRSMAPTVGSWTALSNTSDGTANNAASGDQVRVVLNYSHKMITGSFFSWLAGGDSINLHSEMIMRRE